VILNGSGADEELLRYLWVGASFSRKEGNVELLWSELGVAAVTSASLHALARGHELSPRSLREAVRRHGDEHLVSGAQFAPGVDPSILSS